MEVRQDLWTKSAYAKHINVSPARITQMIKEGKLTLLKVNGGTLVKVKGGR